MTDDDNASLDTALMCLARSRGDQDAWHVLYRRAWPFVFSIAFRVMRDPGIGEDVSQETFLRMARYFPFERNVPPKVFMAYLGQVARNTALDARRGRIREKAHEVEIAPEFDALDRRPLPGEDAQVRGTVVWLARKLSPSDAALLRQLLDDAPPDLSGVAGGLGVTYGAAGVRLHRLRSRIRKLLRLRV